MQKNVDKDYTLGSGRIPQTGKILLVVCTK